MKLDFTTVDKMDVSELKHIFALLVKDRTFPYLAAFVAYALTHHYYYARRPDFEEAGKLHDALCILLDDPRGYGWSFTGPHMLAEIPMPHYLHTGVVMQNFPRLRASREQTLVVLKPDAVQRELVKAIMSRFEEAFLKVVAMREVEEATSQQLDNHFPSAQEWVLGMGERAVERVRMELNRDPVECYGSDDPLVVGKMIAQGCRDYYLSGPLVALVLEGQHAVRRVRRLIGNTLPSKAEKGTIRGDFGIPENMEELFKGAARNLVHASDSPSEAQREMRAWFTEEELR